MKTWHATLLLVLLCMHGCGPAVMAPVADGNQAPDVRAESTRTRSTRADPAAGAGLHRVRQGDTLYSIAWSYGFDYRQVAAWNDITPPFTIYPGQLLRLRPAPDTDAAPVVASRVTPEDRPRERRDPVAEDIVWQWPTTGKLVKMDELTLKNGANISGKLGQPVTAAAAGEVVYSGSGLLRYGKLIIIKHTEAYLSAYAHNQDILIKEGSKVSAGQRIATMGEVSNGMPILHFEIRKNGKPVDPLLHLPKHGS